MAADPDDPVPPPAIQAPPEVRVKGDVRPAVEDPHPVPPLPTTARITLSSQSPMGVQEHLNVLLQLPSTLQLGLQCSGRTEILVIDLGAEKTSVKLMEVRTS